MSPKLKLIADDWGLSPEVNEAIIRLAEKDSIYGVSLLVDAPFFNSCLDDLLAHPNIKIGCHVNLTASWDKAGALKAVSRHNLLKTLFLDQGLAHELERQIEVLISRTQRLDYIDGHHHAHLYPRVFPITKSLAKKTGAQIRVALDSDHFGSWLIGQYVLLTEKSENFLKCKYLVKKDWQNLESLEEKVLKGNAPVIIHPATKNTTQPLAGDSWHMDRIKQFEALWSLVSP